MKGDAGVKFTDVWVTVAFIVLNGTSFILNTYVAPAIPPALPVNVNCSSSHITSLSLDNVAFGSPSILTRISIDEDEHAVGSGFIPTNGLLYTITLTTSPLVIVAAWVIISKFAESKPAFASVVNTTSSLILNSKAFPPEPWNIRDVSVEQIVTLEDTPEILFVIDGAGEGSTVIKTEAVSIVQVTVLSVFLTSLL